MKTNLLSLSAILALGFFTSNVEAQTLSTVTGTTAGAKLIQPLTLSQVTTLHFGTINVLTGAGGTVLLPSNDAAARVPSTGVALSTVAPVATNAAYTVAGTKKTKYALTLPSTITVTGAELPIQNMTISNLTARFANVAGIDATQSTLDVKGEDSFTVGGTLTVGSQQTPGVYAGSFNVSVDYN